RWRSATSKAPRPVATEWGAWMRSDENELPGVRRNATPEGDVAEPVPEGNEPAPRHHAASFPTVTDGTAMRPSAVSSAAVSAADGADGRPSVRHATDASRR